MAAFPKNLALLHIKPSPYPDKAKAKLNESTFDTTRDGSCICTKHNKKIEAFCEKERLLLCITCILEDGHKTHELNSIQNAAQKEKNLIQKAHELTKIVEGKLVQMQRDIGDAYGSLQSNAERSRIETTQFFNEIRKALAERETSLKQKISELLRRQETSLKSQEEKVSSHLKNIQMFYNEFERSFSDNDIKLLSSSTQRMEIVKRATINIDPLDFALPFAELNKENELSTVWKILNPQKYTPSISQKKAATPISAPNGNFAKPTKASNARDSIGKSNSQAQNLPSVKQMLALKKENNPFAMPASVANQFPFNFNILDKNGNKIATNGLPVKDAVKVENKKGTSGPNNSAERKLTSPLRTTASTQAKATPSYYEQRAMISQGGDGDDTQDYDHQINIPSNFAQQEKMGGVNSQNSTPKKGGGSCDNFDFAPKTPIYPVSKKADGGKHDTSGILNSSAYRNTKSLQIAGDQGPRLESLENQFEESIERRDADQYCDSRNDLSLNTNDEILDLLNNEGQRYKGEVKREGYNLNISGITENKEKTVDVTRKEFKTFLYESASREFLDHSALTSHQKLDFSVICQQISSYIYVIGGFIDNSSCSIEKYDIQRGKWEIAGQLSSNRTKFSSLPLPNSNILVLGGKQDGSRIATCEEFCVKDCMSKPSEITLTTAKSGFGALIVYDDIFICGGNDGHSILKTFESYNLKTKKWTSLPSLKYKRDELATAIGPDQKFYAIGGFGGPNNTCLSSVERYDPQTGIWEPLANLNVPRRALAAVCLPDGIYAVGGFDGENYLSTVERYDDVNNEWVFISSMNYPRCTLSAVSSGDCHNIYVFGGFDNGPLNSVERYSVINDNWEIIPPMQYKRFMHASVIISNKIFK
jgi:N-acetylneuraminic acid mutarotase